MTLLDMAAVARTSQLSVGHAAVALGVSRAAGTQQFHGSDGSYAWTWNEWMAVDGYAAHGPNAFEELCKLVNATANAAVNLCDGSGRDMPAIMSMSFQWGLGSFGGSIIPCAMSTGGFGACTGGEFAGGFIAGVTWGTLTWVHECIRQGSWKYSR